MSQFLAEYWHEVDHNAGQDAHMYFTPEGRFSTSVRTYQGHAEIRGFYRSRQGGGERTSRHLFTNLRIIEGSAGHAISQWILVLHADNGVPVLTSAPPIMIADVTDRCTCAEDGRWLLQSRQIQPIFKGGIPTTG